MAMDCSISYCTKGTVQNGNLDRGRDLAGIDNDLLAIGWPPQTPKYDYSSGSPVSARLQHFLDAARLERRQKHPPVCGT